MSGQEIISLVAERQDLAQFRRKHWEGTFDQYLDLVRAEPSVTRNAFQRVYDMILSYGSDVYEPSRGERRSRYTFFTDPTYPETNLVVVRAKDSSDQFQDVDLDCAGILTGWQDVGDYQWTRVDLITGDFQNVGNCSTGRHEISSASRFGLWVWGWGTPLTSTFTENVSYGYPGGMNVQPINEVVIPPVPR